MTKGPYRRNNKQKHGELLTMTARKKVWSFNELFLLFKTNDVKSL